MREDANGQEYLAGSLSGTPPPSPKVEGSQRYLDYQCGLINLHRATGVPPAVKSLNGEVKPLGELSVTGGTYTDVRVGLWLGQEKVRIFWYVIYLVLRYNNSGQLCPGRVKSFAQYQY